MAFTSYKLSDAAVEKLTELIPKKYPDLPSTHHATHKFGVGPGSHIPEASEIKVIGIADDNKGIQALVVTVDDRTHNENGFPYHITWSLDRSKEAEAKIDKFADPEKRKARLYKPMHSNGVIREYGYTELEDPIIITDFEATYEGRPHMKTPAPEFHSSADGQNGNEGNNTAENAPASEHGAESGHKHKKPRVK